MATTMRVILEIPTKVAKGLLNYVTEGGTEPEVIIRMRLAHRQNEPQAPHILWEVELLPNNGRIYKFLTKEDKDVES